MVNPYDGKIHDLKCWKEYFNALKYGRKKFEIRCFDPDQLPALGDLLRLWEIDEVTKEKTGNVLVCRVTYILLLAKSDKDFCLPFPKTDKPVYCLSVDMVIESYE